MLHLSLNQCVLLLMDREWVSTPLQLRHLPVHNCVRMYVHLCDCERDADVTGEKQPGFLMSSVALVVSVRGQVGLLLLPPLALYWEDPRLLFLCGGCAQQTLSHRNGLCTDPE